MHSTLDQLTEQTRSQFKAGTLYVVATPIGNLADITLRALAAFRSADLICAEDTRVSGQLLKAYGIPHKKLLSVREHNERAMADTVIRHLEAGEIVLQVSDAGTPAVSDPGARLVASVQAAGLPVCPIPGCSAAVTALSAAGIPDAPFQFVGFLAPKSGERRRQLAAYSETPAATILYEAPHRLLDTLTDLVAELGAEREVVLARELTKTFETIVRRPAGELLEWVASDSNQQRGEIVLIIAPAAAKASDDTLDAASHKLLAVLARELPTKQAAALAAEITGLPRNALYQLALELKQAD